MQRPSLILVAIVFLATFARAGGPAYVAGISYFDPSVVGTSLTWSQGAVHYYTDESNLSAVLAGPAADAFVANAFNLWTSIPTAAISAIHDGQLAEDVTGGILAVSNGAITSPDDIAPTATEKPIGIVYDEDGSVTDALLGAGASDLIYCSDNSAFGGIDNISTDAHFLHALIVLNGKCAQSSSQLPDLQYHLVRILGRVLGLDWSQANPNVITGTPRATAAEIAGFPLMHDVDPAACVPVANCYSNNGTINPAQPKPDDQAAISRLYPITAQNAANFPGKQIFADTTARIHGSVYFTDANGTRAQPMQGVNVVARWIDPSTGQPSGSVVVTSISGFLFCGNAGNVVTGFNDGSEQSLNRFGSNDTALEGFFDLAGLPIPNGAENAQYQLSVEAVDPLWSPHAGPYGSTSQVQPSGTAVPILLTVLPGGDSEQDILMQGSAVPKQPWYGTTNFASPLPLPRSGSWAGALGGYGNTDFFQFPAQANRTLSVIVNAIDDANNLSEAKTAPVIGMWAMSDPIQSPAPANTISAFNTSVTGETRLDAEILKSTNFRLGIADYRGDGRPDYRYNARVFYGDKVLPERASAAGNTPLTVQGLGLQPDTVLRLSGHAIPVLALSAKQLLANSSALPDGVYDVLLQDSGSGGQSNMSAALTVGAAPTDTIKLLSAINPGTPVGGQAPAPFAVQVVAADGTTPVAGASVQISSSPAVAFSACSGASSCTVLTDQSGVASTFMTVLSPVASILTAKLAPASYVNPKQVQTTLAGTQSQLDLSLLTPPVWIVQGATLTLPIRARAISNGTPIPSLTLNYQVTSGNGTLSATSAQTDLNGDATVNLQVASLLVSVRVTVCVATTNSPCQVLNATIVQASSLQLQAISGTSQVAAKGQDFQPVSFRVVDAANPLHAVMGADVGLIAYIGRMPGDEPILWANESRISQPPMPVILAETQAAAQSDINGIVTFPLSTGGISGSVALVGSATVGTSSVEFEAQQFGP
jgi:hypothetical protein